MRAYPMIVFSRMTLGKNQFFQVEKIAFSGNVYQKHSDYLINIFIFFAFKKFARKTTL